MHSLMSLLMGIAFTPESASFIVFGGDILALATVPSVLLRRSGRPGAALSWVLALVTLPYVGVLLWWVLGRTHLARHRKSRRRAVDRLCERCPPAASEPASLPERLRSTWPFAVGGRRWTEGVFPPAALRGARVLCDGEQAYPAMEAAIAGARHQVRALFYIWQADHTGARFADLLARKARAGVDVKILVDAVGGHEFLRRHASELRRSGAEVAGFLPARFRPWAPTFNFRNHRKLLLVDGDVAFVGGMNIGDEYAFSWHDLACELSGPVVANLDDVFQEDWFFATGNEIGSVGVPATSSAADAGTCTVIASGPDRDENRVHDAFFLGVSGATHRVWVATPYFVPGAAALAALRGAAQRGVDVRLIVPKLNDVPIVRWASRSYYRAALRSGIRIFEYQPRFSHTKAIILDDALTMVGSPNADTRSFRLNFELACFIDSHTLTGQVAEILAQDMDLSIEVTLKDTEKSSKGRMLLESAAHLLSPLL